MKKVSVSGYLTVPNFSPSTLKFFKDFVGISTFVHIVFLLTPYKNLKHNKNIFKPTVPILKFHVT